MFGIQIVIIAWMLLSLFRISLNGPPSSARVATVEVKALAGSSSGRFTQFLPGSRTTETIISLSTHTYGERYSSASVADDLGRGLAYGCAKVAATARPTVGVVHLDLLGYSPAGTAALAVVAIAVAWHSGRTHVRTPYSRLF